MNMHDCSTERGIEKDDQYKGPPLEACEALKEIGRLPRTRDQKAAEELVIRYSKCVAGCTTRMITGENCGHKIGEQQDSGKALQSRIDLAKTKLGRFAFVGLTERWSESMCLFAKTFPRDSGRPYPASITAKF